MSAELPVMGQSSNISGLLFAAGFRVNGSGMDPIAGKVMSGLICEGSSNHDLSHLSPSRFNAPGIR